MTREGAQRIDELRDKLYEIALNSSKLTDPHVLRISEETDRAIVDFLLKQQANKKAAGE
ncbi:aspartyl-phosphate phosphatase Spo0E family protein [Paenibacillus sp. 1001270B_150601_E10]|uniref:aspartyl-phosphate phosphatase Spo0E family protein n=1 Tax=Paenibacillus sp. 1001270B_150601_E10 TaxID=2787079 RepID=UPI0018A1070B|nr:aspartyl-phosphate phosphatase Spo0E family protein [Paenibacillus sp. 1001270B_150601_E10]